jgi:hypothetical protein
VVVVEVEVEQVLVVVIVVGGGVVVVFCSASDTAYQQVRKENA